MLKQLISFVKSPPFYIILLLIVIVSVALVPVMEQRGGANSGPVQVPETVSTAPPTLYHPKYDPYYVWYRRYVMERPTENIKRGAMFVGPHLYKAYQAVDPHIKEAYKAALPHIIEAAQTAGPVVAIELRETAEALTELSKIIDEQTKAREQAQVGYKAYTDTDHWGDDINNFPDVDQAKAYCDSDPKCRGYNSDGYTKSNTVPRNIDRKGVTLFVKN